MVRGQYLDKFIELEKILRNIASRYEIVTDGQGRYRSFLPVGEIIRALYQRELINPQQLRDLNAANKIRNLAAHGEIQNIEIKQGEIVDNLIIQLRDYNQEQK